LALDNSGHQISTALQVSIQENVIQDVVEQEGKE
jgi:hypothetical protein